MSDYQTKPDAQRRQRQAERFARILVVYETIRKRNADKLTMELAQELAQQLHCTTRTIYRDWHVIREAEKIKVRT